MTHAWVPCIASLYNILRLRPPCWTRAQVPGRPQYDASVGVRTRRQAAAQGSGVVRSPTPLPARLMHAVVQLLQQAAAPPDDTADWRELLYGEYSDSGDEGEGGGGGGGGAGASAAPAERPGAGDGVRSSLPPFAHLARRGMQLEESTLLEVALGRRHGCWTLCGMSCHRTCGKQLQVCQGKGRMQLITAQHPALFPSICDDLYPMYVW